MPALDKPLHELREYLGISPTPPDHEEYWQRALAELDATAPEPELIPTEAILPPHAEAFELWFTGVGDDRVYAKYLRPKNFSGPRPALFLFHGYSGSSGDWQEKLAYVGQGFTVIAMDCRGQGGKSEEKTGRAGNSQFGHFIRGIDEEDPDKLLFRQIYLDTAQVVRAALELGGLDESRMACMGGSQGGALSLVCASLEPRIRRCVSLFPFLSDFRRVWEMDLAVNAYEELKRYFRLYDPEHAREDEVFTKLGYLDIRLLAPRIKAEVLMAITLMDNICPPSTQFAAFNHIRAPKTPVIYPDFGHEGLPGFPDKAFNFLAGLL